MFLLDYIDWSQPLSALMSVVFFLLFTIFIILAVISGGVLLFNQLFGYTTYPNDKE